MLADEKLLKSRKRTFVVRSDNCIPRTKYVQGGYYGLVGVLPRRPGPRPPRPQTLHRSHDNLKNPYRIASIFYM